MNKYLQKTIDNIIWELENQIDEINYLINFDDTLTNDEIEYLDNLLVTLEEKISKFLGGEKSEK